MKTEEINRDKLGHPDSRGRFLTWDACKGLRRPVNTPAILCRNWRTCLFLRGEWSQIPSHPQKDPSLQEAKKPLSFSLRSWEWSYPHQACFYFLLVSAGESEDGRRKQR